MNAFLKKAELRGHYVAKPSKSYAHRYLIAAMLSNNSCKISNVDFSDDINATLNCIDAFGKIIAKDEDNGFVNFQNNSIKNANPIFNCNESGTTLRILFPIVLTKYDNVTFIGSERLMVRGINVYEETLNYLNFNKSPNSINIKGMLKPNKYNIPGNISSQYISGLLYALPLLNGDSTINITTNFESKNYILMTLEVIKNFGIDINTNIYDADNLINESKNIYFSIKGNQHYIASDFSIEGDYSNTAFIDAFNYFNSDINISGLNQNSLQSDKIYKTYFDTLNDGFAEIDISNCIDLGPILMVFAALKNGARLTNTKRLKIKESDRGMATYTELKKCHADIIVNENDILIKKVPLTKPVEAFSSHNDHRIAMALSLLATKFDIEIKNAECISKSYPDYFNNLTTLGGKVSFER